MTMIELIKKIKDENLNAVKYNIDYRQMNDDEYGLLHEKDMYLVYLSHERGGYHILDSYITEEEACDKLYECLKVRKNVRLKYGD